MTKRARFTEAEIARVLRAAKKEEAAVEIELSQNGNIVLRPVSHNSAVRRVAEKPNPAL